MAPRGVLVRMLLVMPLLAAGIALGAPRPAAAAFNCLTEVDGITIRDNVVVPADRNCILSKVTIRGGVTVEPGARFIVGAGTEIRGGITATEPAQFEVYGTVVRGNVTVTGAPNIFDIDILGNEVRGDLVLTGNGKSVFVRDNTVRGSVVLRDNVTSGGTPLVVVSGNAIDGNLDCSGNIPDPTLDAYGPNTVGGAATGQCAGLVGP